MSQRKKRNRSSRLTPATEAKLVREAAFWVFVFFGGLVVGGLVLGGWLTTRKHGRDDEVVVDLANTECPACGNPVDPVAFTDWHHLRLHDHAGDCEDALLAKPEDVLDRSGLEWREAARLVRVVNHGRGSERDRCLSQLKSRWQIVLPQ